MHNIHARMHTLMRTCTHPYCDSTCKRTQMHECMHKHTYSYLVHSETNTYAYGHTYSHNHKTIQHMDLLASNNAHMHQRINCITRLHLSALARLICLGGMMHSQMIRRGHLRALPMQTAAHCYLQPGGGWSSLALARQNCCVSAPFFLRETLNTTLTYIPNVNRQ